MTSPTPVAVWDFTLSVDKIDFDDLTKWLKENCKKWCFQLEKGESGYVHYQGRISLNNKTRNMIGKICKECHWSCTSNNNKKNTFYVMKEDTRIKGPWKDDDLYIPKQVRDIELWDWQKQILEDRNNWDTRHINIVICPEGNIGKTTLSTWAGCRGLARSIPIMENYKDLMRFVMNTEKNRLYLVDFPRSLNKTSSHSFWSAIETIKNGYCWDDRYEFREEYFDCPNIWVFCNSEVNTKYLSKDRWIFWDVEKVENRVVLSRRRACNTLERTGTKEVKWYENITIEGENEKIGDWNKLEHLEQNDETNE